MAKHDHQFPNPKPAYLYARFSSLRQKDGTSIERQLAYGRAYIEKEGWTLVEELKDEAKSAFKGANREEGAALYGFELAARNGQFTSGAVLVCENVDRLSRQGAKAAAQLIWGLNEAGVDVATYHDGHVYKAGEDGDLMDLLSIIIKGALSKEESDKKSERSKANWSNIHKRIANGDKGAFSLQCPQWLDIQDGQYVVNEHRAALLKQIYEWYCDGLGSLTILNKLNEMGEDTWSVGKRFKERNIWTIRYIHKLLMTPAVMGEYITRAGETLSKDYYPAVIDAETYYKAQAIREKRRVLGGNERRRSNNLLVGIAKCECCGGAAVLLRKAKPAKRKAHVYIKCNSARYKHNACTNSSHIQYEVIEAAILHHALPLIAKHKDEKKVLGVFDTQMAETKRDMDLKEKQLANIVEAIAEGAAPKALIAKAATLETDIEALTNKIAAIKLQRDIEAAKPAKGKDVALVEQLRADLESEDEEVRFETRAKMTSLLTRLLNVVWLHDDRTFRVVVDDKFSVTYDAEGNAIGWHLDGSRMDSDVMMGILAEDKEAVVEAAFRKVPAPLL